MSFITRLFGRSASREAALRPDAGNVPKPTAGGVPKTESAPDHAGEIRIATDGSVSTGVGGGISIDTRGSAEAWFSGATAGSTSAPADIPRRRLSSQRHVADPAIGGQTPVE